MAESSCSSASTASTCASSDSEPMIDAEGSTNDGNKSVLDVLKASQRSDLARKRSVAQNLPHDGRRHKAPRRAHDPKGVTPTQRVKEFPNECLSVSANKLFCVACREEVALKLSIIKGHVVSSKHENGKLKLHSNEAQEKDIVKSLQAYDVEAHGRGETLPENHRVHRVKVLMAFLRAGILLNKMEHF